MQLYHGTNRYFEHFDLSRKGSGEGASLLIGHGVYLTESVLVANEYRKRTADPRYIHTVKSYWHDDVRFTEAEISLSQQTEYTLQHGSVMKVLGVDEGSLLVWEGRVEDQPFDVSEILRELYDPIDLEAIEAFIEEAEEADDVSMSISVEEVVDQAMLYGPRFTQDMMKDCSKEDVDWDLLSRLIGNNGLDLPPDEDAHAGEVLYAKLENHFGNEELATQWLSKRGIHGVIARLELPLGELTPEQKNARTIVYWKVDDLIIDSALAPSTLEMANQLSQYHEPEDTTSFDCRSL